MILMHKKLKSSPLKLIYHLKNFYNRNDTKIVLTGSKHGCLLLLEDSYLIMWVEKQKLLISPSMECLTLL